MIFLQSTLNGVWSSLPDSLFVIPSLVVNLKQSIVYVLLSSNTFRNHATDSHVANGSIIDDAYFYGQSEPVYPSPRSNGADGWERAHSKAIEMVSQMTIEEKVSLTSGWTGHGTGCDGVIAPIERLNFPGLCLKDAGNGVRDADFVSGYSSGLSVGASWNKALAKQRGEHMAGEFKTKGVNVLLGPCIGPMGRIAGGGRNWESFSPDPYQSGQLVAETINGMHSVGMITNTKHFIANEQETNRKPNVSPNGELVESVSSNIDDKTMHELYLWPFVDALHAGTGSIMCSYNRLNNSYGCQNSKLLNGILKEELNFQGFVVSDWHGQHTGYPSAEAGLDMTMPEPSLYWGTRLVEAVRNGSLAEARLDDMVIRTIATWYQFGQDEGFPALGAGLPADLTKPHTIVDARNPASKTVIFDGAVEGHVLVKNINNALPLQNVKLLSIFGYDTIAPTTFNVGSQEWKLGHEVLTAEDLGGQPVIARGGTMISGGGAGAITPAYWSSPFEALQQRAEKDNSALHWDFETLNSSVKVNPNSDAAIVFINAWAAESYDRPALFDSFSDDLVNNVAAQHRNTIVVIHNAGPRLVDQWIDNPNITAVIFAHLPGQDAGSAIVSLLYGDDNFSGRMPYTLAKNESDYGDMEKAITSQDDRLFRLFPQSNFTEGVYIDYKYFDLHNITPRYSFGFGLSYATFNYSDLRIASVLPNPTNMNPFPEGEVLQGGPVDLWDTWFVVSVTITNTGKVAGKEVAQLYVGIPGGPKRQLRGFEKISVEVDQSRIVEFNLTRRDLSVWDVLAQQWRLQKGRYKVWAGCSSSEADLPLVGELMI